MNNAYIGIDMGATHIRVCVMDINNQIIQTVRKKTKDIIHEGLVAGIIKLCKKLIQDYKIINIVIGLPASISFDRKSVLSAPNLDLTSEELNNLIPLLSTAFNCNVFLERDVNLQLIYDINYYKLKDKFVLGIYLGTGVGFSIWYENNLFLGAHGVAGELGHIPLGKENMTCNCGNKGCLETIYSGASLKNWYDKQEATYPIEELFSYACENIFIQEYIIKIAKAISTAINLFDPDTIILGGGIIDMKNFPINQLKALILQHTRKPLPYSALKIYQAQSSSFNGAIGAALYAKQKDKHNENYCNRL